MAKIKLEITSNSLPAVPSTNQQLLIQFKIITEDEVEISNHVNQFVKEILTYAKSG